MRLRRGSKVLKGLGLKGLLCHCYKEKQIWKAISSKAKKLPSTAVRGGSLQFVCFPGRTFRKQNCPFLWAGHCEQWLIMLASGGMAYRHLAACFTRSFRRLSAGLDTNPDTSRRRLHALRYVGTQDAGLLAKLLRVRCLHLRHAHEADEVKTSN